jgi:hypothetical protein
LATVTGLKYLHHLNIVIQLLKIIKINIDKTVPATTFVFVFVFVFIFIRFCYMVTPGQVIQQ